VTEDELLALTLPPQVDIGNHTLDVAVLPHPDGVKVELRHPEVGARRYRVMTEAVVGDEQAVSDWIRMVAPAVARRLDAEARFSATQAGVFTA
jgi:hypothetical protein